MKDTRTDDLDWVKLLPTCCEGMVQGWYDPAKDEYVAKCPSCGREVRNRDAKSTVEEWTLTMPEIDHHYRAVGFDKVVTALYLGRYAHRIGWNGKGMWIHLQRPDKDSKMTLPYIYMKTADGKLVPWVASQTDILANDWLLEDEL